MMDCSSADALFVDYLEDELPAADRDRLESHLEECPHCSVAIERLRGVTRILDQAEAPPVHLAFEPVMVRQMATAQRQTHVWRKTAIVVASLAACLVAMISLGSEIRWDGDALVIRLGRSAPAAEPAPVATPTAIEAPAPDEAVVERLERIERALRAVATLAEQSRQSQGRQVAPVQLSALEQTIYDYGDPGDVFDLASSGGR